MKSNLAFILGVLSGIVRLHGQEPLFLYDQQSADESSLLEGGAGIEQPIGQSFTPNFSSLNFIRLYIYDGFPGNQLPGTFHVNLRLDSITGPVLASTSPVILANGFAGTVNFFFPSDVSVTPGVAYYVQPVVQNSGGWGLNQARYDYPGGTAIFLGMTDPNRDLWFREGIVVPEPSSAWLVLLGAGALIYVRLFVQIRRSRD